MDNINVLPDPDVTAVAVATDEIARIHYPVYKISYGDLGSQTPVDKNNPLPITDYKLELSKGNVAGSYPLNKFGCAPLGIQTTRTDIWDRADSVPTQQIWLAPTAARIHTIQSDSASDATGGIGANSVIVYYLPDWDTAEQTETVTGNLNAGIAMTNAAVIIHRMKVVPQASSIIANAGIITATAAVDGTITAQINIGFGQTQMAIYGIPSTQTLYLSKWYLSIHKAANQPKTINYELLFNPSPDVNPIIFLSKETQGLQSNGTSNDTFPYEEYKKFTGPGILKIQGVASEADTEGAGGFNGELIDNVP